MLRRTLRSVQGRGARSQGGRSSDRPLDLAARKALLIQQEQVAWWGQQTPGGVVCGESNWKDTGHAGLGHSLEEGCYKGGRGGPRREETGSGGTWSCTPSWHL